MRITPRKTEDRGQTGIDPLDSRQAFAFGHYRNPDHHGLRSPRVVNDDPAAPGG